jgi:integrase
MPDSSRHIPSYRHYKPKNLAVVRINGHDQYLGKYGSPESREAYDRVISEWLANGRQSQPTAPHPQDGNGGLSVGQLILAYWRFANSHYLKDGKPAGMLVGIRSALRPLRQLYGSTPASDFGPKKLQTIRHQLVEDGLSRGVVNKRVGQIKKAFKWAVAEELIPPSVYHGLQAVAGLTFGRTSARETEPIRPVPDLYVAAVLPFVTPHVAAMIKLQRLTGMRPGEVIIMRPGDIDTSGEIWVYEPSDHKGRWRGIRKQIPLGPEAQKILKPFLGREAEAFLFSPRESEAWRLENRPPYHGRQRKTPLYPSELKRRQALKVVRRQSRNPKRPKRERYDRDSYRRAINYGLRKAKKAGFVLPHWHPHQLRHNRGTEVRRRYGIEAAQVALGHARADVTEVYAEKNMEMATRIAREMG